MSQAAQRRSAGSFLGRGDLATSLLLIFPLFLGYEIGILFVPVGNGVDFISGWLFEAVGRDRQVYIGIYLGLAAVYLGLLLFFKRRSGFSLDVALPVLFEALIYSLTLGSFIVFVLDDLLGVELAVTADLLPSATELARSSAAGLVIALGAGVHEELVFRLGMLSGGAWLISWSGVHRVVALGVAFVGSAALFSAAHHVGPYGDPWELGTFLYRFLAGLIFAAIFYFRSLAHAVYTHFLYDVYVLVIRS